MTIDQTPWHLLPDAVQHAVEEQVGSYTTSPVDSGANSATSARLDLADGTHLFVKGQHVKAARETLDPTDDPADGATWWGDNWGPADELGEEVRINPYLPTSSPRVRWDLEAADWRIVAFDWVDGRGADYRPDSGDLEAVAQAITDLGAMPTPPIDLPTARDRWGYYCDRQHRHLLDGGTLLHTDPASVNILIDAAGVGHIIDWAWPAVGAPWIDAALWGMRLVATGHDPVGAAALVAGVPGWGQATPEAVRAFTQAEARRWDDLTADGDSRADGMAECAHMWAERWA